MATTRRKPRQPSETVQRAEEALKAAEHPVKVETKEPLAMIHEDGRLAIKEGFTLQMITDIFAAEGNMEAARVMRALSMMQRQNDMLAAENGRLRSELVRLAQRQEMPA